MNNEDLPVLKAITPEETDQTRNESMVVFKKELREEISKLMHSICVSYDDLEMRIQKVEEKMEKILSKLEKEDSTCTCTPISNLRDMDILALQSRCVGWRYDLSAIETVLQSIY